MNLLDDPGPGVKDAAARGVLPTIYVSTVPAELVQTEGRPDYEPIEGTDLLHVRNSSTNIVLDPTDQRHYLLLSGRWFRSASLADGPVGVRRARQASRRLRQDPGDAPPGRRSGLRRRARPRPRKPSSTTASPRPPR